jgi:hypothetical protein
VKERPSGKNGSARVLLFLPAFCAFKHTIRFEDATDEVRQLLSEITLERCFDRDLWPEFKFFALVRPDNDILPVRSFYNGTTQNIGINYLTSKEPIWFAGLKNATVVPFGQFEIESAVTGTTDCVEFRR